MESPQLNQARPSAFRKLAGHLGAAPLLLDRGVGDDRAAGAGRRPRCHQRLVQAGHSSGGPQRSHGARPIPRRTRRSLEWRTGRGPAADCPDGWRCRQRTLRGRPAQPVDYSRFRSSSSIAQAVLQRGRLMESGPFTFEASTAVPASGFQLGSRWQLLASAARRIDSLSVEQRLRPHLGQAPMLAGSTTDLALTAQETRLLSQLDGSRSLETLVEQAGALEDGLRRLLVLLQEIDRLTWASPVARVLPARSPDSIAPPPPSVPPSSSWAGATTCVLGAPVAASRGPGRRVFGATPAVGAGGTPSNATAPAASPRNPASDPRPRFGFRPPPPRLKAQVSRSASNPSLGREVPSAPALVPRHPSPCQSRRARRRPSRRFRFKRSPPTFRRCASSAISSMARTSSGVSTSCAVARPFRLSR